MSNKVSNYMGLNGNWLVHRVENYISKQSLNQIMSTSPPCQNAQKDVKAWKHSCDGNFVMKDAYELVSNQIHYMHSCLFKLLDHWKGPEKVTCFIWKLCHEYIMTNVRQMRLSFTNRNLCPAYDSHEETLIHLFQNCHHASLVCQFFIRRNDGVEFYSIVDSKIWLQTNLSRNHLFHDVN